jgi:hypothetical protein
MERHMWEWTRLQIHVMETLPFLFKVGWLGSFTLYIFTAKEFTVVPVMVQMCTWDWFLLGWNLEAISFSFFGNHKNMLMPSCWRMWSGLDTADDGGGMGPEGIRQCMSLGYSRKNTNTTIGQCKWVSFSFVSYISWRTNDARIWSTVLRRYWSNVLTKYWSNVFRKVWIACIQKLTRHSYNKTGDHSISWLSFADGNGFKTSTMRLGADVIVFTRNSSGRFVSNILQNVWQKTLVKESIEYQSH